MATTMTKKPMAPATTRPNRETFRDWEAPDSHEPESHWITREDMLAALAREGIAITRDDLRSWQLNGIVPYGVSKWKEGRKWTLYAPWMADLLRELRTQQAAGRSLDEIAMTLRLLFVRSRQHSRQETDTSDIPTATATATAPIPEIVSTQPDLKALLVQLASTAGDMTGSRFVAAEVRLLDEQGRPLVLTFDIQQSDTNRIQNA